MNDTVTFTTREAAEILGLSESALRQHLQNGYVVPIRKAGRNYYTVAALDALRASGHVRAWRMAMKRIRPEDRRNPVTEVTP